MGILVGVFLFGCLVAATVAVGLVFAMSASSSDGASGFEGRASEDQREADPVETDARSIGL